MTNIVALRPKRRESGSIEHSLGSAQILLFMGVRYVRDDPDDEAARVIPAAPKRTRRRTPGRTGRERLKA